MGSMVAYQPNVSMMVNEWINIIQDCLFPPTCILCGNDGFDARDICPCCYRLLPRNDRCCLLCGEILEIIPDGDLLCGRCLSNRPVYDKAYAPFIYEGAISYLVTQLKFGARFSNARLLGMLSAEYLGQHAEMPDCLIPVPLHMSRYRQRGFNQAIELSRILSNELKIPMDFSCCLRHRDTPHQTGLTAKQRHKNIKNAFSITKPIQFNHIAIVDDVMTTGSTVNELAGLFKKAGVLKVDIWVCARA